MIILDTNVVSEFAKPDDMQNQQVRQWVDSANADDLWICSITVAEMRTGVEHMDAGKRRDVIRARVDRAIEEFGRSCLPFDVLAAEDYSRIVASRRKRGRPMEILDAQIAAIAVSTGFTLATMNVKDFTGIDGLTVVDPSR